MFSPFDEIVASQPNPTAPKPGGDIVTTLVVAAIPVQSVRLSERRAHPLPDSQGSTATGRRRLTTTSSARGQSDEEEGLWGARTRPSGCGSPNDRIRSKPLPGQLGEALAQWAWTMMSRPDSRLLQVLITHLGCGSRRWQHWTNERVVALTEYAHTVDWLQRVLAQRLRHHLARHPGFGRRRRTASTSARQFTADPAKEPVRVPLPPTQQAKALTSKPIATARSTSTHPVQPELAWRPTETPFATFAVRLIGYLCEHVIDLRSRQSGKLVGVVVLEWIWTAISMI